MKVYLFEVKVSAPVGIASVFSSGDFLIDWYFSPLKPKQTPVFVALIEWGSIFDIVHGSCEEFFFTGGGNYN